MLAVYCLVVLAFTPCGDAFSVDSWLARTRKERPYFAYAYPILLMQLLMAWTYFSSALIKLRVAGLKYLSVGQPAGARDFSFSRQLARHEFSPGFPVTATEGLSAFCGWLHSPLGVALSARDLLAPPSLVDSGSGNSLPSVDSVS